MNSSLIGLIGSYGYWAVFFLVGIESLGIPLPGETALVTAGALAALGHLSLFQVIAVAAAGAIIGDAGGYWIGRRGGLSLIRKYGHIAHLNEEKLDRVRKFFDAHGAKTVFLGRFVAVFRTWTAVIAGTAGMPYGTFTFYNVLGGITWAALVGSAGYFFGKSMPLLERYVGRASLAAVLLVVLSVSIALGWKWLQQDRDTVVDWVELQVARVRSRFPLAARWVTARVARSEYLGLHLTIGFVVSVAALWLFAGVTEDVLHKDPLTVFDLGLLTSIRAHATPLGDTIFQAVSIMGSPLAMAAVGAVGILLIVSRRDWMLLGGWAAAFAGAGLLSYILKVVIQRPRPAGAAAFLHGQSFSFPSGHALGSLVGYGMLAYVIGSMLGKGHRGRTPVALLFGTLVIMIGISRLYLGVHYFSDVVGGFAAGTLWLAACVSGLEVVRRKRITTEEGPRAPFTDR